MERIQSKSKGGREGGRKHTCTSRLCAFRIEMVAEGNCQDGAMTKGRQRRQSEKGCGFKWKIHRSYKENLYGKNKGKTGRSKSIGRFQTRSMFLWDTMEMANTGQSYPFHSTL